jgi:hypothetical protein
MARWLGIRVALAILLGLVSVVPLSAQDEVSGEAADCVAQMFQRIPDERFRSLTTEQFANIIRLCIILTSDTDNDLIADAIYCTSAFAPPEAVITSANDSNFDPVLASEYFLACTLFVSGVSESPPGASPPTAPPVAGPSSPRPNCRLISQGTTCPAQGPSPAAGPTSMADMRTALERALRAKIPQLPFWSQSNVVVTLRIPPEQYTPFRMEWAVGEREAPNGATSAISISFSDPHNVVFGGRWIVNPFPEGVIRTPDQIQAAFARQSNPCGTQNVRMGAFGPASCLGSSAQAGTSNPSFSGDPYTASAPFFISSSCADVEGGVSLAVFAPASHGPRNKPEVISALRMDAERWGMVVGNLVWEAVREVCGG